MRIALAEKLLVEIMEWSVEEVKKERPLLQAISNFKYNEYQQFSVGTLYIESLVKWLNQFESKIEKQIAYDFIKNQLIFISNNQILHLVDITYNTVIEPKLIKKTSEILGINEYEVSKIKNSKEYNNIERRSLYIGLSDGARIDHLRRSSFLNNEQVLPTYEVSTDKVDDMLKELKDNVNEILKFNTIFLIDDFTASGTSYFRNESGVWKGKVYKTLSSLFDDDQPLSKLINKEKDLDVSLIFYIASEEAIEKISNIKEHVFNSDEKYKKLKFNIHVIQRINKELKKSILNSQREFIKLCKKYTDKSIVDRHWEKAKHEKYWLGYSECCLPIILSHNSPNNSLPLLWLNSKENSFEGLFPRITRHI